MIAGLKPLWPLGRECPREMGHHYHPCIHRLLATDLARTAQEAGRLGFHVEQKEI